MKREVGFRVITILMVLSLSSCNKIVDWGKSNFYQGHEYDTYVCMAKPFIRSVTIYDQLSTRAHFDALLLSDEVRTAYADLHSARFAKSLEHKAIFLRRQLEENDHYISFYFLTIYGLKLGTPESHWTLILEVDGKQYQPVELKLIDLPYEYQIFFGELYNRFKEPYHVRFDARDLQDHQIITSDTQEIKLHVRSAQAGSVFAWQLKQSKLDQEVLPHKDMITRKSKRITRGRRYKS